MADWPGWLPWAITIAAIFCGYVCLNPIILRIRRRNYRARPDGIQVISDPQNAQFELVAVHGLGAHPEYTWTAPNDVTAGQGRIHLLKDFLLEDFPHARILAFAHNSDWLIDGPVQTAQQIGRRLLDQLRTYRRDKGHSRLPIIFIGHSFGGIIIKEALCKFSNDSTTRVASYSLGLLTKARLHHLLVQLCLL